MLVGGDQSVSVDRFEIWKIFQFYTDYLHLDGQSNETFFPEVLFSFRVFFSSFEKEKQNDGLH